MCIMDFVFREKIYEKNIVEWGEQMENITWILCPVCMNKTRIKIRGGTILENFPLFCPFRHFSLHLLYRFLMKMSVCFDVGEIMGRGKNSWKFW